MEQRMLDTPAMIVVTGAMAAGKSTVARLLAQRFARGVHIEADRLHGLIVSGRVGVHHPGTPSGEAARQLALRLRQMCLLGRSFRDAGFAVVLDDIILGDRWEQLRAELRGIPFTLIVLAPSVEVLTRRDIERAKVSQGAAWAQYLHDTLRATLANTGLWIDNTDQEPEETVEEILRRFAAGRIV
jgi:predicted kinase